MKSLLGNKLYDWLTTACQLIVLGFLFLFITIYILFLRFNEPVLWYHKVLGYSLIILGILFIVFSPFGFLLKKYNKGFRT